MVLSRQPLDSSMYHYLRHLSQPYSPSPICYDRMFEGGPPDPESYGFLLCIWVILLTYHGHFWAWISGGIRQKECILFVLLSTLSNLMVSLVS